MNNLTRRPPYQSADVGGMDEGVSSTAVREALARRRERRREREREQRRDGEGERREGEADVARGGENESGGGGDGSGSGKQKEEEVEDVLKALHPDVLLYVDQHELFSSSSPSSSAGGA